MTPCHPHNSNDETDGKQYVILPRDEWDRILEELEELDAIRAYDAAKSEPDEVLPFEQAVQQIRAEHDSRP